MKLLFVANVDWYFNLHWLDRAISAIDNGYEVHVAMGFTDKKYVEIFKNLGFKVHMLNLARTSTNPFYEIRSFLDIYKLIKFINPDLLHTITIKPNLYCVIANRMNRIPMVSTFPGMGTLKVSNSFFHRVILFFSLKLLSLFSFKNKNIFLFENDEDCGLFTSRKILPVRNLIRVFGAGVDPDEFCFMPRSKKASRCLKILFASRLLTNKGLLDLVDACNRLKLLNYDIELSVAGIFDMDSPFSITKEVINKLEEDGKIKWLGQRDDMANLINDCDVVALPSTYGEGVPRILIEACFVGRAIITTPLGGCKDICVDNVNGFLVQPNSPDSIFEALKKFYVTQSLIEKFGYKSRELVEKKFSSHAIKRQNIAIYQQLLDTQSS